MCLIPHWVTRWNYLALPDQGAIRLESVFQLLEVEMYRLSNMVEGPCLVYMAQGSLIFLGQSNRVSDGGFSEDNFCNGDEHVREGAWACGVQLFAYL